LAVGALRGFCCCKGFYLNRDGGFDPRGIFFAPKARSIGHKEIMTALRMENIMGCRWVMSGAMIFGTVLICPMEAMAGGVTKGNIKTISLAEEGPSYSIKAQYPQFRAGQIPEGIVPRLNRELERFIRQAMADALRDRFSGNVFLGHDSRAELHSDTKRSDSIKYEILLADNRYVSIKFERYHYEEGGAHGLTIISTFNYDIARRKIIAVGDLFKPGTPYWDELSKACIEDLLQQLGPNGERLIRAGASPQEKNLGVFALSSEALIIYFQPYQVASYSAGSPQVKIPFERLKGFKKHL
jgi:hypothetical protein